MADNITGENQPEIVNTPTFNELPEDIQFETLINLDSETLFFKAKSICNDWKSIINSPEFKNNFINFPLFLMEKLDTGYKYALFDDSGFHSKPLIAPEPLRSLTKIILLDNVNGYLCFYGDVDFYNKRAVMWNPKWKPTDGKCVEYVSIDIPISNPEYKPRIGFGVHPDTRDVKLVKVEMISDNPDVELFKIDTELGKVHLVSKTAGIWRPQFYRDLECAKVCENGVIYFRAYDNIFNYEGRSNFFVSFNLVTEEFEKVGLPEGLAKTRKYIQAVKINGSLGLLEYHDRVCKVFVKEVGANGFTLRDTVNVAGQWLDGDVALVSANDAPLVERTGNRRLYARAC